jgi:hypothetical protein
MKIIKKLKNNKYKLKNFTTKFYPQHPIAHGVLGLNINKFKFYSTSFKKNSIFRHSDLRFLFLKQILVVWASLSKSEKFSLIREHLKNNLPLQTDDGKFVKVVKPKQVKRWLYKFLYKQKPNTFDYKSLILKTIYINLETFEFIDKIDNILSTKNKDF